MDCQIRCYVGIEIYQFPFYIFCWPHGHRESLSMPSNSNFSTLRALRRWINSLKLSFFYSTGSETTDHFPFHPFFLFHSHRELLSIPLRSIFSTPWALSPSCYFKKMEFTVKSFELPKTWKRYINDKRYINTF